MTRWLILLGGLLVWLTHFLGVYGIASVAEVAAEASVRTAVASMVAFTVACAACDIAIGAVALRRLASRGDDLDGFMYGGGALGAGLSLVAVIWQGLPLLVGR